MVSIPARLCGAQELMDSPGVDLTELPRTLADLAWINRWLGGVRLVLDHLVRFTEGNEGPLRILDVGTGFADIPRALARWARRSSLRIQIDAIDHREAIVRLARRACASYPEIHVCRADALSLPYPDGAFRVVLASLVLHHMEGEEPVQLLRELYRVSSHAVLVNDLRRGTWPLWVTWAALHIVSRDRSIRHDGPLSVRRAFLPGELLTLARDAGWKKASVSRHPGFRVALVGERG